MKTYNKLVILFFAGIIGVGGYLFAADDNKLPEGFDARILKVQLDESNLRGQILQLQNQYQGATENLTHDDQELAELKAEALKAASKDPTAWDVDLTKLIFITKPKVVTPETKK